MRNLKGKQKVAMSVEEAAAKRSAKRKAQTCQRHTSALEAAEAEAQPMAHWSWDDGSGSLPAEGVDVRDRGLSPRLIELLGGIEVLDTVFGGKGSCAPYQWAPRYEVLSPEEWKNVDMLLFAIYGKYGSNQTQRITKFVALGVLLQKLRGVAVNWALCKTKTEGLQDVIAERFSRESLAVRVKVEGDTSDGVKTAAHDDVNPHISEPSDVLDPHTPTLPIIQEPSPLITQHVAATSLVHCTSEVVKKLSLEIQSMEKGKLMLTEACLQSEARLSKMGIQMADIAVRKYVLQSDIAAERAKYADAEKVSVLSEILMVATNSVGEILSSAVDMTSQAHSTGSQQVQGSVVQGPTVFSEAGQAATTLFESHTQLAKLFEFEAATRHEEDALLIACKECKLELLNNQKLLHIKDSALEELRLAFTWAEVSEKRAQDILAGSTLHHYQPQWTPAPLEATTYSVYVHPCAVCFRGYAVNEFVHLSCGHCYHEYCLGLTLARNKVCCVPGCGEAVHPLWLRARGYVPEGSPHDDDELAANWRTQHLKLLSDPVAAQKREATILSDVPSSMHFPEWSAGQGWSLAELWSNLRDIWFQDRSGAFDSLPADSPVPRGARLRSLASTQLVYGTPEDKGSSSRSDILTPKPLQAFFEGPDTCNTPEFVNRGAQPPVQENTEPEIVASHASEILEGPNQCSEVQVEHSGSEVLVPNSCSRYMDTTAPSKTHKPGSNSKRKLDMIGSAVHPAASNLELQQGGKEEEHAIQAPPVTGSVAPQEGLKGGEDEEPGERAPPPLESDATNLAVRKRRKQLPAGPALGDGVGCETMVPGHVGLKVGDTYMTPANPSQPVKFYLMQCVKAPRKLTKSVADKWSGKRLRAGQEVVQGYYYMQLPDAPLCYELLDKDNRGPCMITVDRVVTSKVPISLQNAAKGKKVHTIAEGTLRALQARALASLSVE